MDMHNILSQTEGQLSMFYMLAMHELQMSKKFENDITKYQNTQMQIGIINYL